MLAQSMGAVTRVMRIPKKGPSTDSRWKISEDLLQVMRASQQLKVCSDSAVATFPGHYRGQDRLRH